MSEPSTLLGLRLIASEWCPRGTFYLLGGGRKPDNWPSMTENERLRWAARHSAKVVYNPLDLPPRGRP